MASVLADLALEVESALALGLRVARAFDEGTGPSRGSAVALAKFLNNKRCPQAVYEAMECLGGMGYVEEGPMPLLYREAPLNSIWEGSGNVICLDVLRTLAGTEAARERLTPSWRRRAAARPRYDRGMDELMRTWPDLPPEAEARWFVERLATLLAASVLLRDGRRAGRPRPMSRRGWRARAAGSPGAWPRRLDRRGADRAGDAVLRAGPVLALRWPRPDARGSACRRSPSGIGNEGMAELVEDRVWIDTGPERGAAGSLRAFLSDGTLVMTSCVETYRLAPWRWVEGATLVWEEDGAVLRAEVALVGRGRDGDGDRPRRRERLTQRFTAAEAPVVCPDLPR